ncbi:hypothetical protein GLAREA_02738 [Glarea lozoyensis ATCC 20868]|uniref:Uncharacterized protein n=1 Tax=Glarea lozoyensis (strain ATCC 20868 / MF5171) TaxID=1116229 RepID=S3CNT9_GLAL2|nr:uncharacterized protein GLAREA_02738 [Glarea lozoyensis ATCC 20868]EPE26824.1 hypothetical protein GLAREA_02738 [Glarea lozoyensis ATCC 20868]
MSNSARKIPKIKFPLFVPGDEYHEYPNALEFELGKRLPSTADSFERSEDKDHTLVHETEAAQKNTNPRQGKDENDKVVEHGNQAIWPKNEAGGRDARRRSLLGKD